MDVQKAKQFKMTATCIFVCFLSLMHNLRDILHYYYMQRIHAFAVKPKSTETKNKAI